jgi:hypothetical protein
VDTPLSSFKINDLTLANATRWNASHPDNLQRSIAPRFRDHGADFGSANLKAYKDIVSSHSVESSLPEVLAEPEEQTASRLFPLPQAEDPKVVPL